jgi:hypothetical protein
MYHSHLIIRYCNSLLITFALLSQSYSTNADVITYGCADSGSWAPLCTLQELYDGAYFEVDGLRFDDWSFVSSSYTTPTAPDPSSMEILIFDSPPLEGMFGQGPGFFFDDESGVHGAEYREYSYQFHVSTLNSNQVILNNSLALESYFWGAGDVTGLLEVNESVTDSQDLDLAAKTVFVEAPANNGEVFDFAEFLPQSTIVVETSFYEGGSILNDETQVIGLSRHYQRFGYSVIPIPPALWLFGSGLLGLVGIARRKRAA